MPSSPPIQTPRSAESLSDRAYTEIRDRIINLELEPGVPLAEEDLMAWLELGRTPIREAIKRLALESLIDIYPRRGTFVSEIQMTDLAAISEVRKEIEAYAAELAASRYSDGADGVELAELRERLAAVRDGDVDAMMELDAAVHHFIYRTAGNPYLEETLTRYFNLSFRIWKLGMRMKRGIAFSVGEHDRLLGAVHAGKGDVARNIARQHVIDFEKEMRSVL